MTVNRAEPDVKKTTRAKTADRWREHFQGLKEAIAWTKGENGDVRVTLVHVPEVDVRKVRLNGTQPGAVRDQVRLSTGYAAERVRKPSKTFCEKGRAGSLPH